eukprot:1155918-Rhodomonas_salina.1
MRVHTGVLLLAVHVHASRARGHVPSGREKGESERWRGREGERERVSEQERRRAMDRGERAIARERS